VRCDRLHTLHLYPFKMSIDPSTLAALLRASAVRSIGIVHRCELWEVWVRVGQTLAESSSEPIHHTGGEMCQWASFEAAYAFVRDQGYRGTVEVDDAMESASDRATADLAAAPYTTEPRPAVQTVSGPETPPRKVEKTARSPLALTTPPKKSTTTPPRTTRGTTRPLSGPHRSTRPAPRPAPKDPPG
jgi:hypothetical protein